MTIFAVNDKLLKLLIKMSENGEDVLNLTKDLRNWMGNLPTKLRELPIIYLAIPGSHNSMTYSMTSRSKVSPDADWWMQKLNFFKWPVRVIIWKWSQTQNSDTLTQLKQGIRYFDLRIAANDTDYEYYFCHGLMCGKVRPALETINQYLDEYDGEIVILDFQHFYNFKKEDHYSLLNMIDDVFKTKLFSFLNNFSDITLESMKAKGHKLIIIYRSDQRRSFCCPSNYFPTAWPNTISLPQLFAFLNKSLQDRKLDAGHVSQLLLTPDFSYVLRNIFSTLKKTCGIDNFGKYMEWLVEQSPAKSGKFNVCIIDFVNLNGFQFSKVVINLNKKLLDIP